MHAALGIANLKYFDKVLADRKQKYWFYKNALSSKKNIRFQEIKLGECNYSYFPIIFESEAKLLEIVKKLNNENIFPRRYFYPSVNTYTTIVPYKHMPISEDVSKRVLCLPLYYDLQIGEINSICKLLHSNQC